MGKEKNQNSMLIYFYMKKRGISNTNLSKGIISTSHLSNLLHGRFPMNKDLFILFAKKLDIKNRLLYLSDQSNQTIENEISAYFSRIHKKTTLFNHPPDFQELSQEISFDQLIILRFWESLHYFSTYQDHKVQKLIIKNELLLFITDKHLAEFMWTTEERMTIKNIFLAFYYTYINDFEKSRAFLLSTSSIFRQSYVGFNLDFERSLLLHFFKKNVSRAFLFSNSCVSCVTRTDFISDFNKLLLSLVFTTNNGHALYKEKDTIYYCLYEIVNTIKKQRYRYSIKLIQKFSLRFPKFMESLLKLLLIYCFVKAEEFDKAWDLMNTINEADLLFPFYKGIYNFILGLLEKNNNNFYRFEFQLKSCFSYFKKTNLSYITAMIQEELGKYYFESNQYKKAALSYQEGVSFYNRGVVCD